MTFTKLEETLFKELSQEITLLQQMDPANFYVKESMYRTQSFYVSRLKTIIHEAKLEERHQKWLSIHNLL